MAQTIEVKVPDIGDFDAVPVIEILVADGDTVEVDQPLLVLESDKATMEVPSPAAGTVKGLKVKVGDKVGEGSVVCLLEQTGIGNRESGIVEAKGGASDETSAPTPDAKNVSATAEGPAVPDSRFPIPDSRGAPKAAPPPDSQAGAAAPAMTVTVPNIGDFDAVPVIEILVADGDTVDVDQPLLVLESDKATMEVPSPGAGTIAGLKLKVGDKVSEGDVVCLLERPGIGNGESGIVEATGGASDESSAPAPEAKADPKPAERPAVTDSRFPIPDSQGGPKAAPSPDSRGAPKAAPPPYAGPATRKFARQLGVDLSQVTGSGPRGRIQVEDVQGFVKQRLSAAASIPDSRFPIPGGTGIPPIPAQDFSQFGEIDTQPLARIRKLSAAHLSRSWLNVPHVTQHDDADITELEAFRKQASSETGVKLTLLAFLIKAVGEGLKTYPEFNSSLAPDGESLILKRYCHIGFAADTPNGLVVPVVQDVWDKSLSEIASDCARLAKTARDGKLKPGDMRGGCFSISSLGGIGGGYFTPIVNAPEVAILGVSRSLMKPVWDGQAFQPRLMVPLSLSYDHRVIDGAAAARFIVRLGELLADVRRMLL